MDRTMANVLLREEPEDEEEDEDEKRDDEEEDENEEGDGYSVNAVVSSRTAQADFFDGKRNSITLPRCSGGSHFTRVENPVGT